MNNNSSNSDKKKGKSFLKRDIFGHPMFIKRIVMMIIGLYTFPRYNWFNKTTVEGSEHFENLPETNVLIVSNHQTYFADVIALSHVICSVKWHFRNKISNPVFLLNPKTNIYFVAALETMKAGLLPRFFTYAGSVSIQRTWREAGKDVNRQVKFKDINNIGRALNEGWVITFPQGTTTPYAPGRRGSVHIIKQYQPVVVPVVIDGFRDAFGKKGLTMKKTGQKLSIRIKAPMQIDFNEESDVILAQIMKAIEQDKPPVT